MPDMIVDQNVPPRPAVMGNRKQHDDPATPLTLEPDPVHPEPHPYENTSEGLKRLPPDDIPDPAVPASLHAATETLMAKHGIQTVAADGTPVFDTTAPALPLACGEHEALLRGAVQYLSARLQSDMTVYAKEIQRDIDAAFQYMQSHINTDKDRLRHAETVVDGLITKAVETGIQLRQDPYEAMVQAVSPEGFAVTLHLRKAEAGALTTALPALLDWLMQAGYTAR